METFIQIIKNYWEQILAALLFIAAFILLLIKKPNKIIDSVKELIMKKVPELVSRAEVQFGSGKGDEKLKWVLRCITVLLVDLGIKGDTLSCYLFFAKTFIEEVLSTPQKKAK